MTLKTAWRQRLELRAEANELLAEDDKLWAEGKKLRAEANKLWAEGKKLRAEGDKLWAEGEELWAEGDQCWFAAIREARGNIDFEWRRRGDVLDCVLTTGEIFPGDEPSDGG